MGKRLSCLLFDYLWSVLLAQMGLGEKKSLKLVSGDYSRQFFTFLKYLSPKPTCSLWPKSRT